MGSELSVPPDAAKTCAEQCGSIGLRMSAVAIMANNVGCVCQPRQAVSDEAAESGGTAATAGMTTILLEEADQQQRQAAQQRTR